MISSIHQQPVDETVPQKRPPSRTTAPRTFSPDSPVLCIVVPTFNERANLEELVRRIDYALVGIPWEIIIVDDDSPDGTADLVRSFWLTDPRVRCIQRIGRRGLSSACV